MFTSIMTGWEYSNFTEISSSLFPKFTVSTTGFRLPQSVMFAWGFYVEDKKFAIPIEREHVTVFIDFF